MLKLLPANDRPFAMLRGRNHSPSTVAIGQGGFKVE
jgi:hypothetical protein